LLPATDFETQIQTAFHRYLVNILATVSLGIWAGLANRQAFMKFPCQEKEANFVSESGGKAWRKIREASIDD
jgi:hypothetical protein